MSERKKTPTTSAGRGVPTTRAGRAAVSEAHQTRRAAMREKLWQKVDMILDMIQPACSPACALEHEHLKGTAPRDLKELAVAFGVLLDKYRLETGGQGGDGSDIDDYLTYLGSEAAKPPRSRAVKKAEARVKVH